MFLVRIGHTASRALLHRCYTLAGVLQLFHWGRVANSTRCPRFGRASQSEDSAEARLAGQYEMTEKPVTRELEQARRCRAGRECAACKHRVAAPAAGAGCLRGSRADPLQT